MAREEEEIQKALGTLGKYRASVFRGNHYQDQIDVDALNIEDAIVKAKVVLMMRGEPKKHIDDAEYTVEARKE